MVKTDFYMYILRATEASRKAEIEETVQGMESGSRIHLLCKLVHNVMKVRRLIREVQGLLKAQAT